MLELSLLMLPGVEVTEGGVLAATGVGSLETRQKERKDIFQFPLESDRLFSHESATRHTNELLLQGRESALSHHQDTDGSL